MEVSGVSQGGQNLNTLTAQLPVKTDTKAASVNESNTEVNAEKKVTEKDVNKAVEKLNKLFEDKGTYVQYEVYGKFHNVSIKIFDEKTNQVIKEIPPKKLVEMVEKLCELAGVLVDEKA